MFASYDCRVQVAGLEFERKLSFEGCFNFRDLGGYRTPEGRWTRPQHLYRADGPHALSTADVEQLGALGLATVIDLRTPEEVERGCYASVLSDIVEYHLPMLDVLPDTDELPGWVDPAIVAARYRRMLDDGHETVAEILAILSDPSAYPAMFHCSAGKDRTGVIAAVLLGVLGVPDETIVADYALSAASMHRLLEFYVTAYPDATERLERIAPAMVAADPAAMAGLLGSLRADFGTFDGYADAIGVGRAPAYIRAAVLT
jgi:protein-tyrosine phosphatase